MAKQIINVGANANDGSGDDLRLAMQKINTNFTELFGATAEANDLVEDITPQLGGNLDLQNFVITTNLTNGNISLQPNGTGSVLLKNIRITDNNVISADDSTLITIDDSLLVTGSANILGNLSVPTLTTNTIATEDSSIIQINNGLQVTGTVKSTAVVTNSLSSEDSSAIQVGDNLNVSGDITVTDEVNADIFNTTGLSIRDNNITAYNSNDSIKLTPSGTGHIDVSGAKVKNAAAPTDGSDLATKAYVDAAAGGGVAGVTFKGDDSTGFTFGAGDELCVKGSTGISTVISQETGLRVLRITGPDLSTYVTASGTATLTNKTFNANGTGNSITNIEVADLAAGVLDTDLSTVSASDDTLPSAKAVKAYIDAQNTAQSYTLTFVGDDSTGTAVNTGETLKIAGGTGITTAVSGDVLTITGPDLSSYLTNSTITVVGDDSTGVTLNSGETIKIQGASNIETQVIGDTLTITGPSLNNLLTVVGDDSTGTSFNKGETLKIAGGAGISTAVSGDTLTISSSGGGGGGSIGDLVIEGQTITTGPTNSDITISPNGVGNINLDADRVRVGDLNTNVTISSNGSADLILTTDVDNPSVAGMASITIGDGVDGVTTIRPSDNGFVSLGNTTWTTISAVGARNEHGLAISNDITRNLSAVNLERHHSSSVGARFNLQGTDQGDQTTSPYRAFQVELISNLIGKSLPTIGTQSFDSSSINLGIGSPGNRSYAAGPVALGIQNVFRQGTSADSVVEETACISSSGAYQNAVGTNLITINNLHGVQQHFDLASQGGSSVTDNIRSFVASGNHFSNGNATANNYYAFWAGPLSEATNNYGVYIESPNFENYLGGLTIVNNSITTETSNANLTLSANGTGKVIISNTLNVGTVELNNISSLDSTAIQINDAVNISGTLTAATMVNNAIYTNEISSADSAAIQINDSVNVSGTLNAKTFITNEISSDDSTAIQVNDGLNVSGTISADVLDVSEISSGDSTAVRVLDNLSVSGALEVTQISSSDSSAVTINSNLNVSGTLSVNTIDTNTISSEDGTVQINDNVEIINTLTVGSFLSLSNKASGALSAGVATGTIAFCTDESNGAQIVYYDGTNWRRASDQALVNSGGSQTLSTITLKVNNIESEDSSVIQFNDGIEIDGQISMNGNKIVNMQDPTSAQEAATKKYVDDQVIAAGAGTVTSITAGTGLTGGTITGAGTIALDLNTVVARVVSDDSSGIELRVGETFKIAGAGNVTTAVSGDTITITGTGGAGGGDGITVVGDDSSGTQISEGETLKIAGAQNITTAMSGDILTITGPDLTSYLQSVPKTIDVNVISSSDSSAITISDSLNVSGTLTAGTIVAANISAPSSATGTYTISSPTTITLSPTSEVINTAPFTLYSRTVAQLSSLTASVGAMVYCTNEASGAVPVFYDGTNWRRMTDRAIAS